MAPDLKYIVSSGISNSETISVMQSAMKLKAEQQDGASIVPAEPENEDDLSDVIFDYLGRQKSAYMRPFEEARDNDKSRKDKDFLSDEKVENIAVWIQHPDHRDQDQEARAKDIEARKRFGSYRHHHYFDRWGTVGPKTGKDEEWWIANPPVLPEEDPDFLCDMCRHINFSALLTERDLPGNDLPGQTKIRLHGVDRIFKRKHCAFCRLITEKVTVDGVIDLADEERLKFIDLRLNVIDDGESHGLRLEIELEDPLKQWATQRFVIQRMECGDGLTFRALPVDQARIAPDLVPMWSRMCEEAHGGGRFLESNLTRLRLIDVTENCICDVSMPCRFVALSYVWGGATQVQNVAALRSKLQASGGLTDKLIQLPKTITDAMEVTRWLDIRYLWVDCLCIEQDTEDDKREVIAKMGSIYGGATLTIVAASNQNPYDGLPGVSSVSRTRKQIRGRVQGIELAVAFHDARLPIRDIEDSPWNSRGWTYQERQLSSRILFFTNSQTIFTCSIGTYLEDTIATNTHGHKLTPIDDYTGAFADPQDIWVMIWTDPTLLDYANKAFQTDDGIVTMIGEEVDYPQSDLSKVQAPVFEHKAVLKTAVNSLLRGAFENTWHIYKEAATSFSMRNFTDPRDILPAFQGLVDVIYQNCNVQIWYNLPDCSLTKALLWYPKAPMRRRMDGDRELHPSWTWAGWEGPIKYRDGRWFNSLYCGPVPAVQWMRVAESDEQSRAKVDFPLSMNETAEGRYKTLIVVDPLDMYQIKAYATQDRQQLGWRSGVDNLSNKHMFHNSKYYNHTVFDYPIPLPDQRPVILPDDRGSLFFVAFSVRVRFCDRPSTAYNSGFCVDPFLQIGLNDEDRSSNPRPSWQRIIYHQGYRAGFLTLNVPFESLDLDLDLDSENQTSPSNRRRYRLVALSRDELPQIPIRPYNPSNPAESMDIQEEYNSRNLVRLYYNISRQQYGHPKMPDFFDQFIRPPVLTAVPQKRSENETGDAKWDVDRFGPPTGKLRYEYRVRRSRKTEQLNEQPAAEEKSGDDASNGTANDDQDSESANTDEFETRSIEDEIVYPLYNVLLVEEHGYDADNADANAGDGGARARVNMERYVTRVGVGKMHFQALHHASPTFDLIQLR